MQLSGARSDAPVSFILFQTFSFIMDDVLYLQPVALGDFRFTGAAAVQGAALGKQLRPCCPVNGSIHATAAIVVTAAATAGRAAEVAVESRHILGIARVAGTVRANPRRERQSNHCMSQLHFWREPDEKLEGLFFLTSTRQKSILRGSEIFGYDEKEYRERMLQRAAGWCKAVQGVRGKILSELSG